MNKTVIVLNFMWLYTSSILFGSATSWMIIPSDLTGKDREAFIWDVLDNQIRTYNVTMIKEYLKRGGDIEIKNQHQQTLLHRSAFYERSLIVEELLKYNASVKSIDVLGDTPLMKTWDVEVAKLLLNKNADPNVKNKLGLTALMMVVATQENQNLQNVRLIQLLLERGAHVNDSDYNNRTVLMHAARHNNAMAIKILLDNNVDVNSKDNVGATAKALAAVRGYHNIVAMLDNHEKKR